MSEELNVQQLLREAIAGKRAGNNDRAQQIIAQILISDENNEAAWYLQAQLASDDDERISALTRVLEINPRNERARAALVQLGITPPLAEGRLTTAIRTGWEKFNIFLERFNPEIEYRPGITRRLVIYASILVGIMIALNCLALSMLLSKNAAASSNREATAAQFTATAQTIADERATATAVEAARIAGLPTEAPPTATTFSPTLPPTWTPPPSATPIREATPVPLATVIGSGMFEGRMLAASGPDSLDVGFVPLMEIPLDGSEPYVFFRDRGGSPRLSPRGDVLIYTRYSSATRDQALEIAWRDNSRQPRLLSQLLAGRLLQSQDDGNFSPDGTFISFSAREGGNPNSDIFMMSIQDLEAALDNRADLGETLIKLTTGGISSSAPDWGDSSRMVYVSDGRSSGGTVDLKIVSVLGEITDLTTNGNAMIEDNPDISPEGLRVAFEAYSPNNPDDIDIYIMALSGGQPLLTVDSPGADIRPRWSADSKYLTFSSNRDGDFEIYIVDIATYAVYQVTVNDYPDIVNQWLP